MIFEITQTRGGYYKVDWGKYVTGMDVTLESFPKFLKLAAKHLKNETVGLGGQSCVYNLTQQVFQQNVDWEMLSYNVYHNFRNMNEQYVVACYYRSREEAESFGNDLEQRYIVDILKR